MPRTAIVAFVLLVAPLLMLASEPWKNKAYQEWNEKDVKEILSKSPWTKLVIVPRFPVRGRDQVHPAITIGNLPRDPTDPQAVPEAQIPGESRASTYVIRWASSRTIRRALLRQSILLGQNSCADQNVGVDDETSNLEIVLSTNGTMLEWPSSHAADWQEFAYLKTGKSKTKVVPTRVELRSGCDAENGMAAVFYFSRLLPNGEPLITPSENAIEFSTEAGARIFKTKFILIDMTAKDGADW